MKCASTESVETQKVKTMRNQETEGGSHGIVRPICKLCRETGKLIKMRNAMKLKRENGSYQDLHIFVWLWSRYPVFLSTH